MSSKYKRGSLGALLLFASISAMPLPAHAAPSPEPDKRIRSDQWHLRYLDVAKAHQLSQGEGVIVAVPDTGVDPHPDLRNNLMAGKDFVPGGKGDGRKDLDSHGTGMAGLIAAHGRGKDIGALGIAPKAKILPLLVSPPNAYGDPDKLAEGVEYAISHGADVISISSGGGTSSRLTQAIRYAMSSDIVIVAGAGNRPVDSFVAYPARETGVIAVGGIDRAGQHADISVTGPQIDVVAPATDIYSTSISGKYRRGTGTSDATAIVAGAAALVRSKYPNLPAAEVAHRLTATAIDRGAPGRDDEYGYGELDLVAALTADVPPVGFESSTAPDADFSASTDTDLSIGNAHHSRKRRKALRNLTLLGLVAGGAGIYAVLWRRRRRAEDPPPRISR
ncbi:type VII secretion-associated serine protease mycosin [Micromonospora chersina]